MANATEPTAKQPEHQQRLDSIRLRGVRTHNLKNIDLDIPHGKFVVITGPSGSGKSSLAFDTIFAEGQRQFVDSLSIEARQYFDQVERPDADLIEGLQPTICIDQRGTSGHPRSTVGTVTEIYDHLRLLMARAGDVHCPKCNTEIRRDSATQIQTRIENLPEGTRLMLLAPLVRNKKGEHLDTIDEIRKHGFVRVRVDGELIELDAFEPLAKTKRHSIEAVIDRLIVRDGFESRLAESIMQALRHGNDRLVVMHEASHDGDTPVAEKVWAERAFSTRFACAECDVEYEEIEPRSFSFNSPHGACESCNGLGVIIEFDSASMIPDRKLPLAKAVRIWKSLTKATVAKHRKAIGDWFVSIGFDAIRPLSELSDSQFTEMLRGKGKKHPGLLMLLEKEYVTTTDSTRLKELEKYRGEQTCATCGGSRLKQLSNHVLFAGKSVLELINMTISQAADFFVGIELDGERHAIAQRILPEISRRLEFLKHVGADYLTVGRSVATLSGGEFQRVRLATGIGSGLAGICYILDEPSIGLHQRDNQRLIDSLKDLQSQGNTMLIVEHDEAMMRQAEFLIDVGPGAGTEGGRIVAAGEPNEVLGASNSSTVRYLTGQEKIGVPPSRRKIMQSKMIKLEGATANNLQSVDVKVPLGVLCCVTGVSGSGKSSLLNATLIPAITRQLGGTAAQCGSFTSLSGVKGIEAVVEIDQSPIGRSSRSNAATYTGMFDDVRKIFAASRQAKQFGFTASRFSFNAKAGRCEACQGYGTKKIEMSFLPDIQVTCEICNGKRFNRQTLAARFREKSIADVLAMPVDEAVIFFENHARIHRVLKSLQDVGLGYLPIGQPSNTLSGGEAQRVKLATHLSRPEGESAIYFFDEPTTGLHFSDIKRLLNVLQRLVDKGNSIVVIEHNLDVIAQADWIIDLGPEGGSGGGQIVATGTPEEVAMSETSHTGRFLSDLLSLHCDPK